MTPHHRTGFARQLAHDYFCAGRACVWGILRGGGHPDSRLEHERIPSARVRTHCAAILSGYAHRTGHGCVTTESSISTVPRSVAGLGERSRDAAATAADASASAEAGTTTPPRCWPSAMPQRWNRMTEPLGTRTGVALGVASASPSHVTVTSVLSGAISGPESRTDGCLHGNDHGRGAHAATHDVSRRQQWLALHSCRSR